MGLFNKDLFLNANKEIQDSSGFTKPEDGYYEATLKSCGIGRAKSSGRVQASFIWEIDPEDKDYGGKTVGNFTGLTKDGIPLTENYKYLNYNLMSLGIKDFSGLQDVPDDGLDAWFNTLMEKLEGTKARLHIFDNKGYTNIRIMKLLYSPLDENEIKEHNVKAKAPEIPIEKTLPQVKVESDPNALKAGQQVIVTKKDGQYLATVKLASGNMIMVGYANTEIPDEIVTKEQISIMKSETEVNALKEQQQQSIETLEEEPFEQEQKLEIGMMVDAEFSGQAIVGQIYGFDEKQDLVKVKVGTQGFPCKRSTVKAKF